MQIDYGLLSVAAYNRQGGLDVNLQSALLLQKKLCRNVTFGVTNEGCAFAATLCSLRRIYLFFSSYFSSVLY